MPITIEQSQLLVEAPFQNRAEARMALVCGLAAMPEASMCFGRDGQNRALYVSEEQLAELTQDSDRTTLRTWPLRAVREVTVTSATHRGIRGGLDDNVNAYGALRELELAVAFDDGGALSLSGSEIAAAYADMGDENPVGAVAFLNLLTQLVAAESRVVISWPS